MELKKNDPLIFIRACGKPSYRKAEVFCGIQKKKKPTKSKTTKRLL